VDGTKALGGWSESGCFRPCYDRALPIDALLGAATFNAQKPESYSLPRDALGKWHTCLFASFSYLFLNTEPPSELMQQVFPWIEKEQAALEARSAANSNARDFALKHFLTLLKWLRRVLLQDVAVLSTSSHGFIPLFDFAPFNMAAFRTFAADSDTVIRRAAENARLQLQNLPDLYAHTFRGLVASSTLEQQRIFTAQSRQIEDLSQTVEQLVSLIEMQSASKNSRRHHISQGQFNLNNNIFFLCFCL
jgi:hypothetical protein